MDSKQLESNLSQWSRELGFTLPDGNFPQSTLFSQLTATPKTFHLWEEILSQVKPKGEVLKIRKQILLAKLKSDEKHKSQQDPVLNAHSSGIQRKVELWKKKLALEKRIAEKKKEVDQLRDNVYKRAELIQSESCKLAEIEKNHSNLKEKLLINKLLIDQQRDDVESYEEQVGKMKSHWSEKSSESANIYEKQKILGSVKILEGKMIENLEKTEFKIDEMNRSDVAELVTDKNSLSILWEILLDVKKNNLIEFSASLDDECHLEGGSHRSDETAINRTSLESLTEKFILDITENSLQAISNRKMEKLENLTLREIISNIEKLMFNKSITSSFQVNVSYLNPNETVLGDSLTGRREKMSKFMKALSIYGLKKSNEFLKRETEQIARENKKNDHWTTEMEKFKDEALQSSKKVESGIEEARELMKVQKWSVQGVMKSHNELVLVKNDINNDLNERKVFETLNRFVTDIRKGIENEVDLVTGMCLDAFRRIHISVGKDVYEYECLENCLDHYGGELREFFSTLLLSPYEKPEAILSELEERKTFRTYIQDLISKFENDLRNCQDRFEKETGVIINPETIDKNNKETLRVLSKVITGMDNVKTEMELVANILKSWLNQPFRLMIPDTVRVNSMTLRQFEEKFKTVQSEMEYYNELNRSVAYN